MKDICLSKVKTQSRIASPFLRNEIELRPN